MTDSTVYWDDLTEGQEIPAFTYEFNAAKLFQMSAVTLNVHRIHYDEAWAQHEGYEERVIHGPFHGEVIVQTLQRWIGSSGWLRKIEYSNRRYAVLGEPMTGRGRITRLFVDGERHCAELEVWAEKRGLDGETGVTAPGSALVVLPTRDQPIQVPE